MASAISPSPSVDLPPVIDISPPSPPLPSQPDQTPDSSAASTPPSLSPPAPATTTASPPSPPLSPSTATPTTPSTPPPSSAPPPSPPATQPPTSSPPPPSTVTSPPPSLPNASPPAVSTSSPPPPSVSPPPPVSSSPPPGASPATPVAGPPPPQAVSASPPANVPTPPAFNSPPPPTGNSSAVPQVNSPPPSSLPAQNSPPPVSAVPSPPSPVFSTSSPPPVMSAPASPDYLSANGSTSTSPLPSVPMEKPFARATNLNNVSSSSNSNRSGLPTGGAVAIGIVVGLVILSALAMAVWFVNKKKRTKANSRYTMPSPFTSPQNSESMFLRPYFHSPLRGSPSDKGVNYSQSEPGGVSNSRSWFTYDELIQATNGFSSYNLLGEGGFGSVYKGILVDGREVAVKQLKIGSSQGEREFRAEVEIISRVHHRHLVSLVGYCISQQQRLLVYDYVPNNTLHYHLHSEGRPVMSWPIRVKAAAGAARGIAYLHEDCHPRIIHRDIKSSNILLDSNFEARVSDFGLAKLALELDSNTHVTTRVMGTFGYMAPEYATSGKLTEKSDVYSFGVVLLELITGRKPVDASQTLGDESLVEWARPLLTEALDNEHFEDLVDPRLEKNYDPREMFRMIEAAAACVRHSSAKRPRMSQVVRALNSLDELSDLSNGMKPGQSQIYNSREQSAQIRMFQRMAFGSQDYSSDFFNHSRSSWSRHGSHDDRDRSSIIP